MYRLISGTISPEIRNNVDGSYTDLNGSVNGGYSNAHVQLVRHAGSLSVAILPAVAANAQPVINTCPRSPAPAHTHSHTQHQQQQHTP